MGRLALIHLLAALIVILIVTYITNIWTVLRFLSDEEIALGAAPKPKPTADAHHKVLSGTSSSNHHYQESNCLKARNGTIPMASYGKLPKPYVNLGFPKMGSTSLHNFFKCGGLISTHYQCDEVFKRCAQCARESVRDGLPPLSQCGKVDVFAQLDNGKYFPQIELLEELVHGHPDATFFLMFRDIEKWYHSISHWPTIGRPKMDVRLKRLNISGSPSIETKSNLEEFRGWYCRHVTRVRNLVDQSAHHTLVEVDIEDSGTAQRMQDIFAIDKTCWGHTNANIDLHPNSNLSKIEYWNRSESGF